MSDSLHPRPHSIATVLGVAIPMLVLAGGLFQAYGELAAQQEARVIIDKQHGEAIADLRLEIKDIRGEALDVQILQRLTAVETKLDGIAADKRGRK